MKVRAGFVSNSSSSSFILDNNTYPTVFKAAEAMLDVRTQDEWPDCPEKPMIAKARQLGVDEDIAVTFSTCNYETFIFRHKGEIYVSTCNNHPWWDYLDFTREGGGHDDGEFRDLEKEIYFWHIPEDVVGKSISDTEWTQFLKDNPEISEKLRNSNWANCWRTDEEGRTYHFRTPVRTPEGEIVCPKCYAMDKRPGMLLSPREYNGLVTPVKRKVSFR